MGLTEKSAEIYHQDDICKVMMCLQRICRNTIGMMWIGEAIMCRSHWCDRRRGRERLWLYSHKCALEGSSAWSTSWRPPSLSWHSLMWFCIQLLCPAVSLEPLQARFCGKWVQGSIDCPLKHACGPLAVTLPPWIFRMIGFNPPMPAAPSSKTVNSSEFKARGTAALYGSISNSYIHSPYNTNARTGCASMHVDSVNSLWEVESSSSHAMLCGSMHFYMLVSSLYLLTSNVASNERNSALATKHPTGKAPSR